MFMTTGRTPALRTFCRFRDHQSPLPGVVRGERGNPSVFAHCARPLQPSRVTQRGAGI